MHTIDFYSQSYVSTGFLAVATQMWLEREKTDQTELVEELKRQQLERDQAASKQQPDRPERESAQTQQSRHE